MTSTTELIDTDGWDDRAMLLLGVLMGANQHGYQINEFIERDLCHVTSMKKPTAYALLERLAANGYIGVQREQAGNRPPRKVYSIAPQGRALFKALLRLNLAHPSHATDEGDVGLMMLNLLDQDEAIDSLRERLTKLDALIALQSAVPPHSNQLSVDLALDHLLAIRRADRDWLIATIDRLERERLASQPAIDA